MTDKRGTARDISRRSLCGGNAMVIDAHQHFWRVGQNDCVWPTPELAAIHRDFLPDELEVLAAPLGVEGSVLVQSQPSDRDTDWLLELSKGRDFVKAVVGWTDLKSPGAPQRIAALAAHPKMRGLRPMLQSESQDVWIADRALDPAVEAMIAHRLSFDALVFTHHLPHLGRFAQRHPSLPIVIDHAAKPSIRTGEIAPWRAQIASMAALPNVFCKLSGLLTEAGREQGTEALKPVVDHLLAAFGPGRLMWGSDWPVLNLAGNYSHWLELAHKLCGTCSTEALAEIFAGTATKFYRL